MLFSCWDSTILAWKPGFGLLTAVAANSLSLATRVRQHIGPLLNPVPTCPSMNLSRARGNSRLSSVPCWCPQGLVWRDVGVASSLCLNLAYLLCCSLLDLALEPLGVSVVQGPQGSSALDVEFLSILLGRWSQWAKSIRLIVHFYSKSFKLASIFKAHLWSSGKVPPLGTKGKISVFITCFKTRLLKI